MISLRRAGLLCLIFFATAGIAAPSSSQANHKWPKPIRSLEKRGLTIVKPFSAPGGLQGYAARAGTHGVALYLMPDGKHVIVGTLLDASGHNLSQSRLDAIMGQPSQKQIWPLLADTTWIPDGSRSAPRTVYEFLDPNCVYCHKFFKESRPWVKAGQVQIRHIPVAVLAASSMGKAAALLDAANPAAALRNHEQNFRSGGIEPLAAVPDKLKHAISANALLMSQLKIHGTPGLAYKDDEGQIHLIQGVPSDQQITELLGPHP